MKTISPHPMLTTKVIFYVLLFRTHSRFSLLDELQTNVQTDEPSLQLRWMACHLLQDAQSGLCVRYQFHNNDHFVY